MYLSNHQSKKSLGKQTKKKLSEITKIGKKFATWLFHQRNQCSFQILFVLPGLDIHRFPTPRRLQSYNLVPRYVQGLPSWNVALKSRGWKNHQQTCYLSIFRGPIFPCNGWFLWWNPMFYQKICAPVKVFPRNTSSTLVTFFPPPHFLTSY